MNSTTVGVIISNLLSLSPSPHIPLLGGEYGEMGEIFIKGNYPDMI
ncbi:MAG: hypothetical protein F6J94_23160 [Moorea sp. SIO1F2]|nr:hypothetical protein [Moorena sp. SIO1F2]NET84707.1 hypothetical protein [Moorena sp. SIO1F2]